MTPRVRRIFGTGLLCGGLLSLGIGLHFWFPPVRYAAKSRIKVELERDVNATNTYSAYFMQNEFELIQSEAILGKVVESLDLPAKWGKRAGRKLNVGEALAMLKTRLALQPVRCTSLVEIRITSEDADEATEITNDIAEEYRNHRSTGGSSSVSAEIVDAAAIPKRPIAPNRIHALCWLGLASLLAVVGGFYFAKGQGEVN